MSNPYQGCPFELGELIEVVPSLEQFEERPLAKELIGIPLRITHIYRKGLVTFLNAEIVPTSITNLPLQIPRCRLSGIIKGAFWYRFRSLNIGKIEQKTWEGTWTPPLSQQSLLSL